MKRVLKNSAIVLAACLIVSPGSGDANASEARGNARTSDRDGAPVGQDAARTGGGSGAATAQIKIERKTCTAPDGVSLVYSAAGSGEPALIFIHGGLANRGFWDGELQAFASRHRVIAPDLVGHGESGANRTKWGLPEFGADIRAIAEAERLGRVIIFGNSLGGPVAIEAALLMGDQVLGVVGVDTFQNLDQVLPADQLQQRADAFRSDYAGSLKQMVKLLFHPDADPALVADAERRMSRMSPEAAYRMFLGMRGYDPGAAARRLAVPLLAINGDLAPTDVTLLRSVKADFDAVLMKRTGHYPMLERPAEFDRLVLGIVRRLEPGPMTPRH
jgi:pimeloyl-ACP methyl ester carboxylesterase